MIASPSRAHLIVDRLGTPHTRWPSVDAILYGICADCVEPIQAQGIQGDWFHTETGLVQCGGR